MAFNPSMQLAPAPKSTRSSILVFVTYSTSALQAALGLSRCIVQYTSALRASKVLSKQLLFSVVRAEMRWHSQYLKVRSLASHLTQDLTNTFTAA
jgi:hypothetical protein